jgi:hypothetical protein
MGGKTVVPDWRRQLRSDHPADEDVCDTPVVDIMGVK